MRQILLAPSCAFVLAVHPYCASAQSAQAGTTKEGRDPGEIIVTATKRAQSVQDVPISMTVFDGRALADNNISDFKDLASQIPGLSFQVSPTFPGVALRGFSTATSNPGYDQTVAIYQDGIFAGRGRQFQVPIFDLARVEVLRGSQGSLLGKNTSAGAINFVSASPTRQFKAGLTATYLFERNGTDLNGFVSGPLSETLSARLAVHQLTTTRGYVYNVATGRSDPRRNVISGRISLDFHPSDALQMVTKVEYSDLVDHGTAAANFSGTVPLATVLRYQRNFAGAFGEEDGLKLKPWQVSNVATIALGEHTLVSVSGVQGFKARNLSGAGTTNPEFYAVIQAEKWRQGSQEFRVLSPTGSRFEWIAGLYGDVSKYMVDYAVRYNLFAGAYNGLGHAYFDQKASTISAYVTGTLNVTDQLRAIGGARWTYIRKHGKLSVVQDFGLPFGYVAGNRQDQTIGENHFDPSLTAEFDIAPRAMVYGTWARGSKGGAFQAANRTVTAAQFALDPERAESLELGLKSQAGNWLTFNVAVFQLTFTDLQTGQYVGTPPALINVNVGKSRSRGVEWTLNLRPARGLSVGTVGTYLDAKYVDYPGAPCTFAQLAVGCINGTVNGAGRRLSASTKWSGNFYMDYAGSLTDHLSFFISSNVEYRSKANIDANALNPFFGFQKGFAKVNGRIGIGDIDGSWEVALVARNLTNKMTLNSAFPWGPPFLPTTTVVARLDESRSIGLQFKLGF